MDGFTTLAQLVKETKSGQVVVPDVRNEVESIKPNLSVLQRAGFSAIHDELDLQVRKMERDEKTALFTNRLVEDGYLILDIPFYFKNGWSYEYSAFVKPIQKKITRTQDFSNFWGTHTTKKEISEWIESEYSLVLCQHYNWRGGVPVSVAETLIEFREKYGLEDAVLDFKVLSVLPNSQIGDYVQQVDPLLLYSLNGSEGSRFAVVAWWGADVEAIEKELGLDRESFRAVKVLEEFR